MPPVRRHRTFDQMPALVHPDPDPAAIDLCRDLVAETDAQAVVLFGSRATGGWDEQSDLDMIIVHGAGDGEEERESVLEVLWQLRERHYPGYRDYHSPHHGVVDGQMVKTPAEYIAGRRTLNHVMARAAREGLIYTRDPGAEVRFRHDGDTSNEWELVTLERLRRAARLHDGIRAQRTHFPWYAQGDLPEGRHRSNVHTDQGRDAHGLLWNSGAALLSILGVIYPRDSVAETAGSIARHDAGWNHRFRSDLGQIDQYSDCGCEVVVTDPIADVPAMWRDLEIDRGALWERIRQLNGYDLAACNERSGHGP